MFVMAQRKYLALFIAATAQRRLIKLVSNMSFIQFVLHIVQRVKQFLWMSY